MKIKIALVIITIISMLLCSCNNSAEINSAYQESLDLTAGSSGYSSQLENVSAENNVDESESSSDTTTDRERFIEKYSYNLDVLDCLPNDELYTLLLNNPIEQWASDASASAGTTREMLDIEETLQFNWTREIDVSLNNLKGILSEDIYNTLCENIEHKKELASENRELYQVFLYELELYGTYSAVLTKIQLNEEYRKITFELKYIEYVVYAHYDISDKKVSVQMIEP